MAAQYTAPYNAYVDSIGGSPQEAQLYKDAFAAKSTAEQRAILTQLNITPAQTKAPLFSGPQGLQQVQTLAANAQRQQQTNAVNQRFGTDLSWLDPSFQVQPALLGKSNASGVYADPNTINAQNSILNSIMGASNAPLNFTSPAQQQSIINSIQGLSAPNWAGSDARQQQAYSAIQNSYRPQWDTRAAGQQWQQQGNLRGLEGPQFGTDEDQRRAMESLYGISDENQQQALDALNRISGADQAEQLANLKEIIAGGGATTLEMAARQRQRADQEQWLRSQREADQQDYAERGLTGSGSELMSLAADRQAAAGRNSLADLDTAAQLEQRRMQAIGAAAGLAGDIRGQEISQYGTAGNLASNMRGQDIAQYQAAGGLATDIRNLDYMEGMGEANWNLQREQAVNDLLNQIRTGTFNEQSFQAQNDLSRALGLGDLSSNMRAQNFNEQTYNSSYALDKQNAMANIANTMRSQQANEQIGQRGLQLQGYGTAANLATNLRNSSFNEGLARASAQDQFNIINQGAINNSMQGNAAFLQSSYQQMMNNRQQWENTSRMLGIDVASGLMGSDRQENEFGYSQGTQLAGMDANAYNQAQQARNATLMGTMTGTYNQVMAAQNAQNAAINQAMPVWGNWMDSIVSSAAGNPYQTGSGTGGSTPMSQPGQTWAGGGAYNPQQAGTAIDWDQWGTGSYA